MEFIDNAHKEFYEKKMNELTNLGKTDVYYKSLIYTLSICETTREHFTNIFNIKRGEININSIESAWQTGTSAKVTRMAFSLWNRCMYDSEEDRESNKMSSSYNPSEIFCCSYAPYFWEAIKIRYPEYTNYEQNDKVLRVDTYTRVGNIEQLDYNIKEKIENKRRKVTGLYIRVGCSDDKAMRYSIDNQKNALESYCKENNITNIIEYIDIGKSGLDKERKALEKMLQDVKDQKINTIIVKDVAKLFRNPMELQEILEKDFMKNIKLKSLDNSIESLKDANKNFKKILAKDIKKCEKNHIEEEETI